MLLGIAGMIGAGCAGGPEGGAGDEVEMASVERIGEAEAREELEPARDGEEEGAPAPEPGDPAMEEIYVGDVESVREADRFALIEIVFSPKIEPGENLLARSADGRKTAEMILSPERKRWYLIGDVISGYPGAGDRVYYQRAATRGPVTTEEEKRDQRGGSEKKHSGTGRFGGR